MHYIFKKYIGYVYNQIFFIRLLEKIQMQLFFGMRNENLDGVVRLTVFADRMSCQMIRRLTLLRNLGLLRFLRKTSE